MATREYLSKTGMQSILSKLKDIFDTKADASAIPSKTSELENDSGFVTTDTNTTYTFATGDADGQIKITPSEGEAQNVSVKGLGSLAYSSETIPTVTDVYSATSEDAMSGKAVASAVSEVKTDISKFQDEGYLRPDVTWELGAININGEKVNADARLRTDYIKVTPNQFINIFYDGSGEYLIYKYDIDKKYIGCSTDYNWVCPGDYNVGNCEYIIIGFKYVNGQVITDIEDAIPVLTITRSNQQIAKDVKDIQGTLSKITTTDITSKQDKIDNSLNTTSKTIVGAINEIDDELSNKADASHTHDYISPSEKGANSGVASLGTDGKIPSAQLPSYVDDVLEYAGKSNFPGTGESGKIYVDTSDNKTYRWSGTTYVSIGNDLALGETSSTAYAGDKGKANAEAISSHTEDSSVHMTSTEKTKLSGIESNANKGFKDVVIYEESNPLTYKALYPDLNGIKAAGYYRCGGGNTILHKPEGVDAFGMMVYQASYGTAYCVQEIYTYDGKKYVRNSNYDTWTDWQSGLASNGVASSAADGLMSATDKTKLDSVTFQNSTVSAVSYSNRNNLTSYDNYVFTGGRTLQTINTIADNGDNALKERFSHSKDVTDCITIEDIANGSAASYVIPESWIK